MASSWEPEATSENAADGGEEGGLEEGEAADTERVSGVIGVELIAAGAWLGLQKLNETARELDREMGAGKVTVARA